MAQPKTIRFGGFETVRRLPSQGGQGRVYEARCVEPQFEGVASGDTVLLKVMTLHDSEGDTLKRLKRRTEALAAIRHPNIVRYYGVFSQEREDDIDPQHIVVMEYLHGHTLRELLDQKQHRRGLDADLALQIIRDSLAALQYAAQEHKLIHRDIKPGNIFVCDSGEAKLIDFELARQDNAGATVSTQGNLRGSYDYMAPDFIDPAFHGDEQSDIFSLAVCLHEALSGRTPYERVSGDLRQAGFQYMGRWRLYGKEDCSGVIQISQTACKPVAYIQGVLRKALSPERAERFTTFLAFKEALDGVKIRKIASGDDFYELLHIVGHGGFGEVFKGRRISDGRLVAIKHLLKAEYAGRFVREAKLIRTFANSRLVPFIEFLEIKQEEGDNQYFLVMDFLPGMPGNALSDRLRDAREGLSYDEVITGFIRFAEGLELLHRAEVFHRDIKPSNLYLPEGHPEQACIMDMGVARDAKGSLTFGNVPGTLDFMPPEVAFGDSRGDAGMDIYALGLCLYEALTAQTALPRLPAGDAAVKAFLDRANEKTKPVLNHPRVTGDPQLHGLLLRMTNPEAAHREQSARAVADVLQDLLAALTGREPGPTTASLPVSGREESASTEAPTRFTAELPTRPPPEELKALFPGTGMSATAAAGNRSEEKAAEGLADTASQRTDTPQARPGSEEDRYELQTSATVFDRGLNRDAFDLPPAGETVATKFGVPKDIPQADLTLHPPVQGSGECPTQFLSRDQIIQRVGTKASESKETSAEDGLSGAQNIPSITGEETGLSGGFTESGGDFPTTPGSFTRASDLSQLRPPASPAPVATERPLTDVKAPITQAGADGLDAAVSRDETEHAADRGKESARLPEGGVSSGPTAEQMREPVVQTPLPPSPTGDKKEPLPSPVPALPKPVPLPPPAVPVRKRMESESLRTIRQLAAGLLLMAVSGLLAFGGWWYWDSHKFERDVQKASEEAAAVAWATAPAELAARVGEAARGKASWEEKLNPYLEGQTLAVRGQRSEKVTAALGAFDTRKDDLLRDAQKKAEKSLNDARSAYKGTGATALSAGDSAKQAWEAWTNALCAAGAAAPRSDIETARDRCVEAIATEKIDGIVDEYGKGTSNALQVADDHAKEWESWIKGVGGTPRPEWSGRLADARLKSLELIATSDRDRVLRQRLEKAVGDARGVGASIKEAEVSLACANLRSAVSDAEKARIDVSKAKELLVALNDRRARLTTPLRVTVQKEDADVTVRYFRDDGKDWEVLDQKTGAEIRPTQVAWRFSRPDYEDIKRDAHWLPIGEKAYAVALPSGEEWVAKARPSLSELALLSSDVQEKKWKDAESRIEKAGDIRFDDERNRRDWQGLCERVGAHFKERKAEDQRLAALAKTVGGQAAALRDALVPVDGLPTLSPADRADARIKAACETFAQSLSNRIVAVACAGRPLDTRSLRLNEAQAYLLQKAVADFAGAELVRSLGAAVDREMGTFVLCVSNQSERAFALSVGNEAHGSLGVGEAREYRLPATDRKVVVTADAACCARQEKGPVLLVKGGGGAVAVGAFELLPGILDIVDSQTGLPPVSVTVSQGGARVAETHAGCLSLKTGNYDLVLRRDDYAEQTRAVAIQAGATDRLDVSGPGSSWAPCKELVTFRETQKAWADKKDRDALRNYPVAWVPKAPDNVRAKADFEQALQTFYDGVVNEYRRKAENYLLESKRVAFQIEDPEKQTSRKRTAESEPEKPGIPDFLLKQLGAEQQEAIKNGVALKPAVLEALEKVRDAHTMFFNDNYPRAGLTKLCEALDMGYRVNVYDVRLAEYFYQKAGRKLSEDIAREKKTLDDSSSDDTAKRRAQEVIRNCEQQRELLDAEHDRINKS